MPSASCGEDIVEALNSYLFNELTIPSPRCIQAWTHSTCAINYLSIGPGGGHRTERRVHFFFGDYGLTPIVGN